MSRMPRRRAAKAHYQVARDELGRPVMHQHVEARAAHVGDVRHQRVHQRCGLLVGLVLRLLRTRWQRYPSQQEQVGLLGELPDRFGRFDLALLPTDGLCIRPMNDAQVVMNAAELAPATAVRLTVPGERTPVP